MAKKKTEDKKTLKYANFSSILMVILLSASFILESLLSEFSVNYSFAIFVIAGGFFIVTAMIRNSINLYKLAFSVPMIILLFYILLMMLGSWNFPHFFLVCTLLCAVSCLYSNFNRTVAYVIAQHLIIAYLFFLRGTPLAGRGMSEMTLYINWGVCLFSGIILLFLTRMATIVLNRALENKNSFDDLLATTENYVAMINSRNEIIYASKTLAMMGNVEDSELIQGRPLLDIFPGKSLKINAGKLLKEKNDYTDDWEFFLNGQKRYFKAISHSLVGSGGNLISLYDMTHLAERDEIAAMKDNLKIGLFFIDKNFIIQDHYSRYLEVILSEQNLFGKVFTDIIADSVTKKELDAIVDYFSMILEGSYDQDMLDDINPLNEIRYVSRNSETLKVLQCGFVTVERGNGEFFILVTIYDITEKVELQQRLAEEESRRQEEMQSVFEVIKVEPDVFSDFLEDMDYEFDSIDKIQKDTSLTPHDLLVKTYQSVHAIKSNAVILGLNIFGNKMHNLESKIKKLRESEGDVPFAEMLNLTMDIEKIAEEKDGFRDIISKLQSYGSKGEGSDRQNVKVLVESLAKTTSRAAEDMGKKIKFIASDVDAEAIDNGPRRVMKEILMQFIRNSAVHGIELPENRKALGKNETGIIKLSIKIAEDRKNIHIKLNDDGRGLDYKKIANKALSSKLIKKEEATNKDVLMKVIFSPGFSTAETEGIHAGRGIGLNLVRDRIKEVGGLIKLRSEDNKGTLFFVSLPVNKK